MDLAQEEAPAPEKKASDDDVKKKGIALITHDLKQKKLVPIKVLIVVVLSGIGVLLPYMTIHMKALGITVAETAIIYGIYPIFAIFAPFSMGIIADKLGNFKVLLCSMFVLTGINGMLFLAIPAGRYIEVYPMNMSLALGCSSDEPTPLLLSDLDSRDCQFNQDLQENVTLTSAGCGYLCYDEPGSDDQPDPLPAADWSADGRPPKKFHKAVFLQQDTWGLEVSCSTSPAGCILQKSSAAQDLTFNGVTSRLNLTAENTFPIKELTYADQLITSQCSSFDQSVHKVTVDDTTYRQCRSQCVFETKRSLLCTNEEHIDEFNPQTTFWAYLLLRVTFAILLGGTMVLFEGACLAVVIEVKGDLGLQRMFGIIGVMIFSPISGALIDYYSQGKPVPDFRSAFYLYGMLTGMAALMVLGINLDFKPPAENLIKDLKILIKNVELVVFFFINFMSGVFWGYIESYLFWFLEDMGGTKSLMGLTLTLSAVSGVPVLIMSDKIFRTIGHPNVQIIGFLFYLIRLIGYSYIVDPYMCLLFEVMEAITTALMTTSAVAYAAELGTTKTLATIQGVVAGTYYGMGRGAGSFVGGFLMKGYGTRATFRILGVAAFATAIFYFLFNRLYIIPKHRRQEKQKKAIPVQQVAAKENGTDKNQKGDNGHVNDAFVVEKPSESVD